MAAAEQGAGEPPPAGSCTGVGWRGLAGGKHAGWSKRWRCKMWSCVGAMQAVWVGMQVLFFCH